MVKEVEISKKEKRREQLLVCGRDIFAEKGYLAATVDDITSAAQVARGTFYLYFRDKRDIFEALVDGFLERIDQRVSRIDTQASDPPMVQLYGNLLRAAELAREEPTMLRLVLLEAVGVAPEIDEKLNSFWRAIRELITLSLTEGQELGLVRPGDKQLMAAMGLGAIKETLLEIVGGQMDREPNEFAQGLIRFLMHGILTIPEVSTEPR